MKGRKIGKYELEATIGEGSFGKVYLGRYGNQQYALKCISKKNRSLLEIRNLKMQTDLLTKIKHKNIIMLKECLETESQLVIVMEYAGSDLSELLRKSQKFSQQRVRMYAKQILDAMLYLKENRIMHRDLKPQNILLEKDQIKICDFGFAKQMSASTQFLRSIKGTPLYIAPEILIKNPYTDKVDVWSFGVILYQLFTGRPPFYARTINQLQPKILHDPVKFPMQMSPHLRDLIDGMLQKKAQKRFDWQTVKKHPFFTEYPDWMPETINQVPIQQKEPQNKKDEVQWNLEEQCAFLSKCDSDFSEGKVTLKELRYNEQYCLRVTRFFGESCLSRQKIPQDILLSMIKLITKISMQQSEPSEVEKDLIKNKDLFTAVITLGLEEKLEEFLQAELKLIGFLLKQNFDGIRIDTDLDSDITNMILRRLEKKKPGNATVLCLKVLGILTSQAIMTLSESEQYFERITEEKLLTQVAQCYFLIPETHTVLECLQKFLHPPIVRSGRLSYKIKSVFRQLKEEVAEVFLSKGFIKDEPITKRKWNHSSQLQYYCGILYECMTVSEPMRLQFLKYSYWDELLLNKKTRMYFLGFAFLVLKHHEKVIISNEMVQNQTIQGSDNKLGNVFLLYLAYFKLKNHPLSKTKIQKIAILFNNIQDRLVMNQEIKKKHCFQFEGSLSENGQLFDDILISIISSIVQENQHEEVIAKMKVLLDDALKLPLSEDSLITILSLIKKHQLKIQESQSKKLSEYFIDCIKMGVFEDLLSVHPEKCKILIQELLTIQNERFSDEKELNSFVEIMEKHDFLRFLFSEQLTGEEITFIALKTINKFISRVKSFDLINTALNKVKQNYKTQNQDFRYEIIIFCSSLARINSESSKIVSQSGVVALCLKGLTEGSESLKEKTLYLIGNLSKYSQISFDSFEQHGILAAIAKCLATYKDNPRILKNTIYAIGNISYYSNRFAQDIRPMIKFLSNGLVSQDDHLLLNTLSTISNLLRHGQTHLQTLIQTETFSKVIDLYSKARTAEQVNYFNNLIKKAVIFPDFLKHIEKKKLKAILDGHMSSGIVKSDNQNTKKLRQLLM